MSLSGRQLYSDESLAAAHDIVRALNDREDSPLYGEIKLLGVGRGRVAQAPLAQELKKLFAAEAFGAGRKGEAFREESKRFFVNYLKQAAQVFGAAWNGRKYSIKSATALGRSFGLRPMLSAAWIKSTPTGPISARLAGSLRRGAVESATCASRPRARGNATGPPSTRSPRNCAWRFSIRRGRRYKKKGHRQILTMPFAVVAGDPAPQQLTAPCRKYSGRLHPPLEQVVYRSISFRFMHLAGRYGGRHRRKSWVDYIFDRVPAAARFLPVVWIAISSSTAVYGQQPAGIAGRVVDARSGAGIDKVLVLIEDGGPSTQTDATGAFRLASVSPGPHKLYVSVVGYILVRRDVQVPPGTVVNVTIPLSEGTGTYTETVTVAADRFRTADPGVASQQVLGSADIQNLRGVLADDPLRAVQVLPGVAAADDLRSEFSVRGSHFTHLNMTVEGFSTPYLLHTVRAVEDQSSSGSVAMINSDILEDVTLLNGGYAQRYGDRTGAELDFRLREGSRERRQARVAVSGTSASVVGEGPLGRSKRGSWLVTGRQSYLQLLVERVFDESDGFNFGFSDTQGKIVFDLSSSQRVEFTVIAGHSKLEERREDLDSQDLFTGRNGSVIGIGLWRLTRARGVLTARVLSSFNEFSNQTLEQVKLDDGHDKEAAGRLDASLALAAPRPGRCGCAGGVRRRDAVSSTLQRRARTVPHDQ